MRRAPSGHPYCVWDDTCPALGTFMGLCGVHWQRSRRETQPGQLELEIGGAA